MSLRLILSAHYFKFNGIFSRRLFQTLKLCKFNLTCHYCFHFLKLNLKPIGDRFHITPSKFDFSNNFLLQLAQPTQWTTTYVHFHHTLYKFINYTASLSCHLLTNSLFKFPVQHMEILMHMLAARHCRVLEEQKFSFITPHLTAGIQAISKDFYKSRKKETFKWESS